MRIERHNGRNLVCGHIFPTNEIEPGQEWASSSNAIVVVESVDQDLVTYTWTENGETKRHTKEAFAFQCRYCMVLPAKWYAGGKETA